MTPAQLLTFKSAILAAQPTWAANNEHGLIADYYNEATAADIWRPSITVAELNTAIVWSDFAALTVAKQQTYMAMITAGFVDATSTNIRNGFNTVFGSSTSLTNLTALAKRPATRLESLFTTSGVCTIFGEKATIENVVEALGS